MKYLVVISIENYQDPELHAVPWALNDADAVVSAFELHGYAKAEQRVLRGDQATRTRIASQFRRLTGLLTEKDDLSLYFVGNAFSVDGEDFLAAWDTQHDDAAETAIELSALLDQLSLTKSRQIAVFVDAHSSIDAPLTSASIASFARSSRNRVVFLASDSGQASHSSGALKRGIWSYHLIEALCGRAPVELERGTLLTATSLQNYVAAQVPRTVAETFTDRRSQQPQLLGVDPLRLILADIATAQATRALPTSPESRPLPRATFRGETSMSVKRLSGYQSHYKIPKTADKWSQKWVETAGAKDVEAEIDQAYADLRDAMQYKRRELKKGYDGGASGTIVTPDFDYNISIHQDPQSPGAAIIRREVTHIRVPAAVLSDSCQKAFAGVFDTIAFSTVADVDVAMIIDRLEEDEPAGIELLSYDDACTHCKIRVDGISGIMTIARGEIQIVSTSQQSPRELAQMFVKSWNALLPATPNGMLLLPGD